MSVLNEPTLGAVAVVWAGLMVLAVVAVVAAYFVNRHPDK
jgi:hypothetical protein